MTTLLRVRQRGRVPQPKAPKPPRPQSRKKNKNKKTKTKKAIKKISPLVIQLVGQLRKINSSTTANGVAELVTMAGDVLQEGDTGEERNAEIEALLAKEEEWKVMAKVADPGLQGTIVAFMERYGELSID